MTTTIQNLSDLQDRRIMMDKKLPPYGYAFVILTGLFMIFLVIWSTQTNRIYVSQNSGVVQAANKTYIMSSYSGSITELKITQSLHPLCDREALRVLQLMPKWKPGVQNDKPCATMVAIPIVFQL